MQSTIARLSKIKSIIVNEHCIPTPSWKIIETVYMQSLFIQKNIEVFCYKIVEICF